MSQRQKIIRSDGETQGNYSESCPKCGHLKINRMEGQTDFDTSGWFAIQNFTCESVKCGHKWVEKFRITQ